METVGARKRLRLIRIDGKRNRVKKRSQTDIKAKMLKRA